MRSIIFPALGFCAAVFARSSTFDQYFTAESPFAHSSTVDQYIATESPIAKAGLLANIGPSGSKSSGAAVCI